VITAMPSGNGNGVAIMAWIDNEFWRISIIRIRWVRIAQLVQIGEWLWWQDIPCFQVEVSAW
jgi:hypothetical protein